MKGLFSYYFKNKEWIKAYKDKSDKEIEDSKARNEEKNIPPLPYHSLSPVSDADTNNTYCDAIKWALENRNEDKSSIKNIALTGPLGSGKSSVLTTFLNKNKDSGYKCIHISLATFKDELKKDDDTTSENNSIAYDNQLRLIELSILQQIFYHEEDKNIPDSRFRKIKSLSNGTKKKITAGILLLIFSMFSLFYQYKFYKDFMHLPIFPKWLSISVHCVSFILFVVCITFIIYKSIRFFYGSRISKLKFNNAEIEIGEGISKSVFNKYFDEILYFFEATKTNVVIIEDLDRFEQSEIFTKLREINLLINSSKKVKDTVVFIYAVRDDMFKDKDRAKFFDFIVPVIPVINCSNSSEKLLAIRDEYGFTISDALIDNISLFIDDMRLLYNIFNEFYIYSNKLDNNLNQDKLLSMIVYKNIFSNDFTKLSQEEGVLYDVFEKKKEYVNAELQRLDTEIDKCKVEVNKLESLKIIDVEELRQLYILKYLEKLQAENSIGSFSINNKKISFKEILLDANFKYLIDNQVKFIPFGNYHPSYVRDIPYEFDIIDEEVNKERPYLEREKEIKAWNNNKVGILKKEISEIVLKKKTIKNNKIKELVSFLNISVSISNDKQAKLVHILLRNGYIAEDYFDYISLFHAVSITKRDYNFLLNVKSQKSSEPDYKLDKIENLIAKIDSDEFSKEYTLNYDILSFMLENTGYDVQLANIFKLLSNESDYVVSFIDGFIDNESNIAVFIKKLCKEWDYILEHIKHKTVYDDKKKDKYFRLILEYAEMESIESIDFFSDVNGMIVNRNDFLSIIKSKEKLKQIITAFDIKFIHLDFNNDTKELLKFVYEGDFYSLNIDMIRFMLEFNDSFNKVDFDTRNYYCIKNSGCENLINYVDANIDEYIMNIYLEIDSNIKEEENFLVELLKNEILSIEDKKNIIQHVETKVSDISAINDYEVDNILFEESKCVANWNNVYTYYEYNENSFNEILISFLNKVENAEELSKYKIPIDKENSTILKDFIIQLINTESIIDTRYDLLLKSVPYAFNTLSFETLSVEKVKLLLKYKCLVFTESNYNKLRVIFSNLHIEFIESNLSLFLKSIDDFIIDQDDVLLLLQSNKLTVLEKENLISKIDESLVITNASTLAILGALILNNVGISFSETILNALLTKDIISQEDRIKLFNKDKRSLPNDIITMFLSSLGEPYSEILEKDGKKPLIEDNSKNRKMLDKLKANKFFSSYSVIKKGLRVNKFKI